MQLWEGIFGDSPTLSLQRRFAPGTSESCWGAADPIFQGRLNVGCRRTRDGGDPFSETCLTACRLFPQTRYTEENQSKIVSARHPDRAQLRGICSCIFALPNESPPCEDGPLNTHSRRPPCI